MDKLPHYIRKVHAIKAAMTEISTSVEKMKKRAENLRVDAQSRTFPLVVAGTLDNRNQLISKIVLCDVALCSVDALKKENKRDALSQWNKLYAAKSSDLTGNGAE